VKQGSLERFLSGHAVPVRDNLGFSRCARPAAVAEAVRIPMTFDGIAEAMPDTNLFNE
jgi:hypothetical protein